MANLNLYRTVLTLLEESSEALTAAEISKTTGVEIKIVTTYLCGFAKEIDGFQKTGKRGSYKYSIGLNLPSGKGKSYRHLFTLPPDIGRIWVAPGG